MRLNENNLRGLEGTSLIHLAGEDCLERSAAAAKQVTRLIRLPFPAICLHA